MKNLLFLVLIFFLNACASTDPAPAKLPTLKGKRVLVTWGGWDGHQPEKFALRMEKWLKSQGAEVIVTDSLEMYADSVFMASLDLVIPSWTMATITPAQEKGLLTAVRNGLGMAGCHGGFGDSFRNNPSYQFMVGGQWVEHPGGSNVAHEVRIKDLNDPIMAGISNFNISTEQYYMLVDPNVNVLATTQFNGEAHDWIDGAVMPVAWKKYHDNGRIFYFSIGHSPATFEIEEVWTILTRGIQWASGSRYEPKEEWMSPVYK